MWNEIEEGKTVGRKGPERGRIVKDLEHVNGARITLEKNGTIAPFSITCGIYGLFFHTTFSANEEDALAKFTTLKQKMPLLLEKEQSIEQQNALLQEIANV